MKKTFPILLVLIVLAAAIGFVVMRNKPSNSVQDSMMAPVSPAVMDDGGTQGMAQPTGMMDENAMDHGTDEAQETAKSFTLEGSMYKFTPNTITVKKGDTVSVTLKSVGGMHDFVLDAFNARTKRVNTGESDTVSFLANKTGTFEFYCSVANHRAMGMVGTLTVTQ